MTNSQQGMGLILIIVTLAIVGIFISIYFTRTNSSTQSPAKTGQQAIEDAKAIQNQSTIQSQQIREQLGSQNDLNSR